MAITAVLARVLKHVHLQLKPIWAQRRVSSLTCYLKVLRLIPVLQKFLKILVQLKH